MIIPSPTRTTVRAPPKFHEQLGIIGNSELQGRVGRSRVRRSEPAIHIAAVQPVRRPEPSGQVGDLPLRELRLGRGSGSQCCAQHLGGRGYRRRSANVGRWAVRRSRTVCGSCLTRHSRMYAPLSYDRRVSCRCTGLAPRSGRLVSPEELSCLPDPAPRRAAVALSPRRNERRAGAIQSPRTNRRLPRRWL